MKILLSFLLFISSLSAQIQGSILTGTFGGATQAATPTFSPAAGAIASGTTITISTSTSGCGSKIYWSFVHNPPTTSDTNSTTSSAITTGSTLYAKVIGCVGFSDSAVGSAAYTISGGASFIVNAPTASGTLGASVTTNPVDAHTANFAAVVVGDFNHDSGTDTIINSSSCSTWHMDKSQNSASNTNIAIFSAYNCTFSSSETITVSGGNYTSVFPMFFLRSTTSPVLDQSNSAAVGGTGGQTGAVVPTVSGEIIISGAYLYTYSGATVTVDSGINLLGSQFGGYLIYNSTASLNPTYAFGVSQAGNAQLIITTYKP